MKTLPLIALAALVMDAPAQHEHARHAQQQAELWEQRQEMERIRRIIERIERAMPVTPVTPPRKPWSNPALERLPEVTRPPLPTMEDYARAEEARRARSNEIFEKYWGDRR